VATILVTGATGFIGSRIAYLLRNVAMTWSRSSVTRRTPHHSAISASELGYAPRDLECGAPEAFGRA
jgi:uncharacterized protein YbjT (DUF2867 family)